MYNTLGIIEVCSAADEKPGGQFCRHLAQRRFGSQSLLEWVVRRVTEAERLDRVIVVLGNNSQDRSLAHLVPPDVLVCQCSGPDPMARMALALQQYPSKSLVRVRIDCPFLDPLLIDRLVRVAQENPALDYIGYCLRNGQPTVKSRLGVFAEWCLAESLARANRETSDTADRQEVTRYLYSHPEKFRIRLIPVPSALNRYDVRLTIGGQEDWEHAEQIFEALGPEQLDWQRIAGLLQDHPALCERMRRLNRSEAAAYIS